MRRVGFVALLLAAVGSLLWGVVSSNARAETPKRDPHDAVFDAESLFAYSMEVRDYKMFQTFIAEDAIFFGGRGTLRGKAAILAGWKPFFAGAKAPFSWRPQTVEVLQTGTLAHSSGPVTMANGKPLGTFNSVWRLEADGQWRVVFDKGCDVCDTTRAE
jgi:ketosteroid isomerase-like protein